MTFDRETFDHVAYTYRAWPGSDPIGVVAKFEELIFYVESLIHAEREACAKDWIEEFGFDKFGVASWLRTRK
jgi:hypothetical protein